MSEINIMNANCFDVFGGFDAGCFDAVITDPPYASGGLKASARRARPSKKYMMRTSKRVYPEFQNDGRDQRTHMLWSAEWMRRALRVVGVPNSDVDLKCLSIGVINDDNPGFLFVEQDNTLGTTLTGVRISKENFTTMLKQFGGEDFTATKPAEEAATE